MSPLSISMSKVWKAPVPNKVTISTGLCQPVRLAIRPIDAIKVNGTYFNLMDLLLLVNGGPRQEANGRMALMIPISSMEIPI